MQTNEHVPPLPALKRAERVIRAALPEFLRFAAVGVASAGVYFSLLWFFAQITRASLTVRATLAYGTGMIFNYLVQRSFTFRSGRHHHQAGPRYVVIQLGGLLINSGVLWVGVDLEHWWFPPVQFAAIVLTAIWSYFGQKFWAFEGPGRQG